MDERELRALRRQMEVDGEIDRLDEAETALVDVAWYLHELAAESLPAADVDAFRADAGELAWTLEAALPLLDDIDDGIADGDAGETAAELLRDLTDQRLSRQELSRHRQDGRVLARDLLSIAEGLELERQELLASLDDDEDEDEVEDQ